MNFYRSVFGATPETQAIAKGRVNLIGEHTDYNDGFVFPTLISRGTKVSLTPRKDDVVRVSSATASDHGAVHTFKLGHEARNGNWVDYIKGATRFLSERGYPVKGFDATVESDLPMGSGLSSSAALEVAVLRALRNAFHLDMDDLAIAKAGQSIEREFVGANVGIMDPLVISVGEPGKALFIDTKTLTYESIPLPLGAMDLAVIGSGISHRNAEGGYNKRRSECELACVELGVKSLREISSAGLARLNSLGDTLRKRARHVVTENARVVAAVEAMKERDMKRLGKLFLESHHSMRDDYEVSIPEIDNLVDVAAADPDVFGARMTGGGFGGAVVVLCRTGSAPAAAKRIVSAWKTQQPDRNPSIVFTASHSFH